MNSIGSESKEGEERPPAEPPPASQLSPPSPASRGVLGRIIDWFWGGSAFRELRSARPSARTLELRRRSRAALDLAGLALEPDGPKDAFACDLCAQSVYWSLLARESLNASPAATPSRLGTTSPTLESLWKNTDRGALERAAGNTESAETMGRALIGRTFVDYAELGADEQAHLSRSLFSFARALFADLDGAARARNRLRYRRLVRLSIPVVTTVVAVLAIRHGLELREQARDVARQKPWAASSRGPQGGCTSPAQQCPTSPNYFFSTLEQDNPWVEFDLGSLQPVSSFSITNRLDCCMDRAIPLVVELSTDHTQWKEVARRTDGFQTWSGSFPAAGARWVRLRVARRSVLHLASVRLFR